VQEDYLKRRSINQGTLSSLNIVTWPIIPLSFSSTSSIPQNSPLNGFGLLSPLVACLVTSDLFIALTDRLLDSLTYLSLSALEANTYTIVSLENP